MKITIERTTKVVNAYGVHMRVWEGKTESGARVACLVDHLMVEGEDRDLMLEEEKKSDRAPSPSVVAAFGDVIELAPPANAHSSSSAKRKRSRDGRRHA